MASHPIYQFYAELEDYKPKIWRRFQVLNDMTLAKLGYIVQVLFEMQASHLMRVEVPVGENRKRELVKENPPLRIDIFKKYYEVEGELRTDRYEFIDDDFEDFNPSHMTVKEIRDTKLHKAVNRVGDMIYVIYDFGDDWWVILKLEKIFDDAELLGKDLPRVLDGAGFGIIEDVGGTPGLAELAKAFKKKSGAKYEEYSEWLGITDLDMTAFDIDDMNYRIKKIPRIYKQSYEDYLEPTQKSIDLIERKYLKKKK